MSKPSVYPHQSLLRKREGKMWLLYRREADGSIGPLLKVYGGPLARLRSWWHCYNPHVIEKG